jgi:alkylation response protein AidB-like acyl-CoA dehydrogenase
MALLPVDEVEILDNWHTLGLRGSGSCDFVARDVFVPDRRCFEAKAHRGGPVHQMNTLPMEHAALPIGIARRALDEVRELALEKVRIGSSRSLAHRNVFQREFGRMEMAWRSVRSLFYDLVADAWEPVRAGHAETQEQDLLLRNGAVYATDVCLEIATTCLRFGGATALFESHPLQRCYRNLSAAGQHLFVTDENYEALGQLRLGLSVEPRLFPGSNRITSL